MKTERRDLQFKSMDDILADVEALATGNVQAMKLWTPAQIVEHVTLFINGSLDGFNFTVPWFLRLFGRIMKKTALSNPLRPGLKLPPSMQSMEPDKSIKWEKALGNIRYAIGRIQKGHKMEHPYPIFGKLSHEEHVFLHCRHAELHFSFMHAGD